MWGGAFLKPGGGASLSRPAHEPRETAQPEVRVWSPEEDSSVPVPEGEPAKGRARWGCEPVPAEPLPTPTEAVGRRTLSSEQRIHVAGAALRRGLMRLGFGVGRERLTQIPTVDRRGNEGIHVLALPQKGCATRSGPRLPTGALGGGEGFALHTQHALLRHAHTRHGHAHTVTWERWCGWPTEDLVFAQEFVSATFVHPVPALTEKCPVFTPQPQGAGGCSRGPLNKGGQ